MASRFWREAATLIIVGRSARAQSQIPCTKDVDYELLFLKRSNKSKFMPSAFVFPGGVVEISDFCMDWLEIFEKCGHSNEDLIRNFKFSTSLPNFYNNKSRNNLIPEAGFRIAAIRETFEESGVLLTNSIISEPDLTDWRKLIQKDSTKFIDIFKTYGGCPDIYSLHDWQGWLTPADMEGRRFDTAFYITFLDRIPAVLFDKSEMSEVKVDSPSDIMKSWMSGALWLPPPQVYELSRFLRFPKFYDLESYVKGRSNKGMECWMPVRVNAKDGFLSVLPGDDLYPIDPDYSGERKEKLTIKMGMKESRANSKNLHRIEISSNSSYRLIMNIEPNFGHYQPIDFNELSSSL